MPELIIREPGRPKVLRDGINTQIYIERADLELLTTEASKRKLSLNELIRRLIRLANIQTTDDIDLLRNDNAKLRLEIDAVSDKAKRAEALALELAGVKEELATKSKEMNVLIVLKNHQDDEILKLRKRNANWWLGAKPM
jgi:hypothetical protein